MPLHLPNFLFAALAVLGLSGCQEFRHDAKAIDHHGQFRLETIDNSERIVIDARINGRAARLALDTGTGGPFVVYGTSVLRLGLKVAQTPSGESPGVETKPTPGRANVVLTAPAMVELLGRKLPDVQLAFLEFPSEVSSEESEDGLIGWPAIRANLWAFDFSGNAPFIGMADEVTSSGPGWIDFSVRDEDTLSLTFSEEGADYPRLIIDTGNDTGVLLPPEKWREWKTAHPDAPMTIHAGYLPGQGITAKEVAWADEIRVGDLVFHGVPVEEADPAYLLQGRGREEIVALGLAALKRLFLIVDGRTKVAHAHDLDTPPQPYQHNRVGAEFIPGEGTGDDLVAHVLPGGPAYRSGIRDGDVLVTVNGRPVVGWRQDPARLKKLFNTRAPRGTTWQITVRRDGATIPANVVAEDLLGPGLKRLR
ncbi:MAG: PDZ domain-containing protein [Opitutaceae bacterium]